MPNSVAQVLSSDFPRSWHEAVAIVQEAASQLHGGLSLPGPADLEIGDDGTLTFGFGDESSEHPVAALAVLLSGLLQGVEAPGSLRELAAENAKPQPAHSTVESFSSALAFFERPNRINDLRAVAGRLRPSRPTSAPTSSPEEEFQKLREKVAHADEGKPAEPKKTEKKKKPKQRKWVLTPRQQALAGLTAGVLVFGTLALNSGTSSVVGSAVSTAELGVQGVLSGVLEFFGISKAAAEPAPAPGRAGTAVASKAGGSPVSGQPLEAERAKKPEARAGKTAETSRPGAVSGTGDAAPRRAPARSADPAAAVAGTTAASTPATNGVTPVAPLPPPPGKAAQPERNAAHETATVMSIIPSPEMVYTEEDSAVRAPALLRPQLPREPAPGDDTGYFDMLIDETGNVASVKLFSPRRRYHDRMLVAAAKAWKFRPAVLDGQPVKYRIRIPIILSGMP